MSDPRELVPRNGSDKYLHINFYYNPAQSAERFPVLAHDNAEIERSLSTNNKLSTKNVLCCQISQTTKHAVRVAGHDPAHAMPIT